MAFPAVEIGRRIKLVREELGVSISTLAEACGVSVEVFTQVEAGTLTDLPGDYVLIASRVLKTDFRYFISDVLDALEKETRQVFRSLSNPTSADLFAIKRFMAFCSAEQELEAALEVRRAALPPKYPLLGNAAKLHKDQGRIAALQERERLLLGNRPISNVFDLIRKQSVRLYRHRMIDAELSGVTVSHPIAGVCVLINYDEDLYRQFFSAAHEYAHVLFDRDLIDSDGCVVSYRYRKKELVEIRANAFAAEFLLPLDALGKYPKPRDLEDVKLLIGNVCRDYKVNGVMAAIRLKEKNWIGDKTLSSFQETKPVVISKSDKIDPDIPSNLSAAQSERFETAIQEGISAYFLDLLRRGLTENVISFGRFAEMLDMSIEDAREFTHSVGLAL